MPHYDPQASTTNDVVRRAVIPLSRTEDGGGVAYATLLDPAEDRGLPTVMVTHSWTNLFLHLVAAVVADALGLDEYDGVAAVLAGGDCGKLRALQRQGRLGQVVWICAFSVNQHASICDEDFLSSPVAASPQRRRWERGRRDTVTQEVFLPCTCSQPKLLNSSFPDECELNKFSDMIKHLHKEVPDFSHLVAVDEDYDVFTRAWCIAELHQAHFLGVQQRVCLQANRVLDIDTDDLTVYKRLATLTVLACEASRPQDKAEILSRIPDTQEFDEQLQEVIFGTRGLLRRQFVGFGVLEAAARTAFRVSRLQSNGKACEGV